MADDEIQLLRENLMTEHTRCLELEKELKDVQFRCSCSNREAVEVSLSGVGGQESSNLDEVWHILSCSTIIYLLEFGLMFDLVSSLIFNEFAYAEWYYLPDILGEKFGCWWGEYFMPWTWKPKSARSSGKNYQERRF